MKTHSFVNRLEKLGVLRKLALDPNDLIARRQVFRSYRLPPNIKFNGISELFKAIKNKLIHRNAEADLEIVDFYKNPNRSNYYIKSNNNDYDFRVTDVTLSIDCISHQNSIEVIEIIRDRQLSHRSRIRRIESCLFVKNIIKATLALYNQAYKDISLLDLHNGICWESVSDDIRAKNSQDWDNIDKLFNAPEGIARISSLICDNRHNEHSLFSHDRIKLNTKVRRTREEVDKRNTPIAIVWSKLWCKRFSVQGSIYDIVQNKLSQYNNKLDCEKIAQSFTKICIWIEQAMFRHYDVQPIDSTESWASYWNGTYDPNVNYAKLAHRLENGRVLRMNETVSHSIKHKDISKKLLDIIKL